MVQCTDLWIIEHMLESSARSAEVGAVLDSLRQDINYTIHGPGATDGLD